LFYENAAPYLEAARQVSANKHGGEIWQWRHCRGGGSGCDCGTVSQAAGLYGRIGWPGNAIGTVKLEKGKFFVSALVVFPKPQDSMAGPLVEHK
jgi:hypothetical protein